MELEMEEGCPLILRSRILKIWESAARSMEKGTGMQRKLAALLFIRTLLHGKEDPYLMARFDNLSGRLARYTREPIARCV